MCMGMCCAVPEQQSRARGLNQSACRAQEEVTRQCDASLALSMLLLLKQHLRGAYALTSERVAAFNPSEAQVHASVVNGLFPSALHSAQRSPVCWVAECYAVTC